MATAIVSAARGVPVRADVAMTGEITLSGLVLPVGGIREKALAARRHGIKTMILPQVNEPDLVELPPDVRSDMTFVPVAHARGGARGVAAVGRRPATVADASIGGTAPPRHARRTTSCSHVNCQLPTAKIQLAIRSWTWTLAWY